MKWVDEIEAALIQLGGASKYSELYDRIEQTTERKLTPKWKASVRQCVEAHSPDSLSFQKNNNKARFKRLGKGVWAVISYEGTSVPTANIAPNSNQEVVHVEAHSRAYPFSGRSGLVKSDQTFTITHADDRPFEGAGLRSFFEYAQLGIREATGGEFGAHVIRAVPGERSPGAWHSHDLKFQMVYVTKGWVEFEYAGHGRHILRAGSCVIQPAGIVHREIRHSDDMELVEITSPAEFETREEDAPA